MANTYKNAALVLTTTAATDLYTVPANTRAIVQSVNVANVDGSDRYVTVTWYDSSAGASYTLLYNGFVPAGTSLNALDTPLVLEAGDILRVQASAANALHATASVLQIDSTSTIVDASVTAAKLADLGVTTAKLADGSITTIKLADNSVTRAKAAIVSSVRCLATGTSQTIPTGTLTAINFPAEEYDTDSMHSTSTNTSRVVVPFAGLWLVNTYVGTGSAGGNRYVYILRNGSQWMFKAAVTDPTSSSTAGIVDSICAVVPCSANDYIESAVFHNTGSAIAVSASSWMTVTYLGKTA